MKKLFLVCLVTVINIGMSRGLITWRKATNLNPDEIIEINHEFMKVKNNNLVFKSNLVCKTFIKLFIKSSSEREKFLTIHEAFYEYLSFEVIKF